MSEAICPPLPPCSIDLNALSDALLKGEEPQEAIKKASANGASEQEAPASLEPEKTTKTTTKVVVDEQL